MSTDDRPSIAELKQQAECVAAGCWTDAPEQLLKASPVLLEIAAAAHALGGELQYLIGPASKRLQDALSRVRP